MSLQRPVVVTGGPGAGKTTLLVELAARGYPTVGDSARAALGMLQEVAPLPASALTSWLACHPFHRTVFVLPP